MKDKRKRRGGAARKKKRKKPVTSDKIRAVLLAALLIAAAAVGFLVVVYLNPAKARDEAAPPVTQSPEQGTAPLTETSVAEPPKAETPPPVHPASAAPRPAAPAVPGPQAAAPKPVPAASLSAGGITPPLKSRGVLAFVIDDAGNNLRDIEPFLKFPGPLTIAVLPALPYSAEAARRIRAAGKELFLHQPMEALAGHDPGPGAIRTGMGRDEIRAIISRNLEEVGPVAGINNHEGSRFTMDGEAMETVLALCRERGILFLDSRTTAETAAPKAAERLGMVIGERDVFIDNVQEREAMTGSINTGLVKAEQKGSVILIGHVWSAELAPLLEKMFPDLIERGYTFSSASKVIRGTKL